MARCQGNIEMKLNYNQSLKDTLHGNALISSTGLETAPSRPSTGVEELLRILLGCETVDAGCCH